MVSQSSGSQSGVRGPLVVRELKPGGPRNNLQPNVFFHAMSHVFFII